jgi:hypothetical protein
LAEHGLDQAARSLGRDATGRGAGRFGLGFRGCRRGSAPAHREERRQCGTGKQEQPDDHARKDSARAWPAGRRASPA